MEQEQKGTVQGKKYIQYVLHITTQESKPKRND